MSGSDSSEVQELHVQEKDVIIDRVRKLFGDDVAQKFQGKLIKKLPESLISVSGPVRKKLKDFKSLLDTHIPLTRSVSSFASYVCLKIHNLLLQNAEWPPNGECL